jgi:hypothetical protein
MPNPAFIWPADRAWCVTNDVDPHWAGIAATAAAIDDLLASPALDMVRADPTNPRDPTIGSGSTANSRPVTGVAYGTTLIIWLVGRSEWLPQLAAVRGRSHAGSRISHSAMAADDGEQPGADHWRDQRKSLIEGLPRPVGLARGSGGTRSGTAATARL